MIVTIRTFTRKSTLVPWHHEQIPGGLLFSTRLDENFVATGKILNRDVHFSVDDLIMTVTIYWDTLDSVNSHFNDPLNYQYFHDRDAYNEANDIVMSDLATTEI